MTKLILFQLQTLHYLAVQQAMVSIQRPVHSEIKHINLLRTPGKLTVVRPKAVLNTIAALSQALLKPLHLLFKNCQNRLLLKHGYVHCQVCNYIDDPPTLNLSTFSLPSKYMIYVI